MNTYTDKAQENKGQSVANTSTQKKNVSESTFQFEDNRPEAMAQRKLQEMANNSPKTAKTTQLKTMAEIQSIQPMKEEEELFQKKENRTGLPDRLKIGIENLSGYSMDDVKVHRNSDRPAQLNAHAFAQGSEIHLSSGQEKHLPHEAWHVVQQKQGRVKPSFQMKSGEAVNDIVGLEKEADNMGLKALRIERSLENERVFQAKLAFSNKAIIQRTVTQIVSGDKGKIGSLNIVGRPDRVFGNSMGDHTTAFATHVEAVKLRMEGKTYREGYLGLKGLYLSAKNLPGYDMRGNLPTVNQDIPTFGTATPHGNRLINAEKSLLNLLSDIPEEELKFTQSDQTFIALTLQDCVNAYLEFRELIPLSAINVMSVAPGLAGKGKGESGYASVLANYEKNRAGEKSSLQNAIKGVLDVDAAALVVAAVDSATLTVISPGLDPLSTPSQRVEYLATQHLQSIRDGFPASFAASEIQINDLAPIIIDRAKKEMKKNGEILATRLVMRSQRQKEIGQAISSKVDNSVFNRNYYETLSQDVLQLTHQIESLNSLLENKIELPKNVVALEVDTSTTAEQEEAQDREEENLEKESKKSPLATQIKLSTYNELGGNTTTVIESLKIAGRPFSPISGSMGAHTSAWILHTDRIAKALLRKNLGQALEVMNTILVPEAFKLEEDLKIANPPKAIGQEVQKKFLKNQLINRQSAEIKASPTALAFILQQYVNELLSYINFIPGVTRAAVDTTGHGEGKYRKILIQYESEAVNQQNKINTVFRKANPSSPKKTGRTDEKPKRPRKYRASRTVALNLQLAVKRLLDVKELSEKDIYKASHQELIRKTYPNTWAALAAHELWDE
jgi:hypothetical protein